eukprot:scaffold2276_cov160-Amphora_coffeaeformis.AAC.1
MNTTGTFENGNSLNAPGVSGGETTTRVRDTATDTYIDTDRADNNTHLPSSQEDNTNNTDKVVKFIEPWHIVLGDHQRRADRTTDATELLTQVKMDWKRRCLGMKRSVWLPRAVEDFRKRLEKIFSDEAPADLGLVLRKCTKASKDRVRMPFTYAFRQDNTPLYGIAQANFGLEYYLLARDPPVLTNELDRYRSLLECQPFTMSDDFSKTLDFFQERCEAAEKGNNLAQALLDSLHPINALREQWKLVQEAGIRGETQVERNTGTNVEMVDECQPPEACEEKDGEMDIESTSPDDGAGDPSVSLPPSVLVAWDAGVSVMSNALSFDGSSSHNTRGNLGRIPRRHSDMVLEMYYRQGLHHHHHNHNHHDNTESSMSLFSASMNTFGSDDVITHHSATSSSKDDSKKPPADPPAWNAIQNNTGVPPELRILRRRKTVASLPVSEIFSSFQT